MNIYVCVKHVPDSAATITVEGKNGINEKITFLVNPYDEHALTEAAKLRNSMADGDVVAVCLGKPAAEKLPATLPKVYEFSNLLPDSTASL